MAEANIVRGTALFLINGGEEVANFFCRLLDQMEIVNLFNVPSELECSWGLSSGCLTQLAVTVPADPAGQHKRGVSEGEPADASRDDEQGPLRALQPTLAHRLPQSGAARMSANR